MFGRGFHVIRALQCVILTVSVLFLTASCTGSSSIGAQDIEGTTGTTPTATLQAYNASGAAPLTVGLDASASSATAGIQSFDYDFDGDGTYDELGGADNTSHVYTTPGDFTARVRVTATDGGIAYATATVRVSSGSGGGGGGTDPGVVQDPDADLAVYPNTSVTGSVVVIDASRSLPNTTGTLTYDYDLDGDGDYDRRDAGTHFEYSYDEAGTYNVKVRVTNEGGKTDTATFTVRIDQAQGGGGTDPEDFDPPFLELGFWPSAVETGEEVNLDASNSWARDGSDLTYEYDFDGDGDYDLETTENGVTHVYDTAGTYTVTVRVTDGGGRQNTATVTVTVTQAPPNQAPSALLSADPSVGEAPLEVSFDASLSYDNDGTITAYRWTFGDGSDTVTGGATASHTYTAGGTYTAQVLVRDDDGAEATATVQVTVQQQIGGVNFPEAKLSAVPTNGDVPLKVNFDAGASSDPNGTIVEYRFDFDGDGTFDLLSLDPAQSYTYTANGTYNASVTVEDNDGLTDTAGVSITVGSGGGGQGMAPVVVISATPSYGSAPLSVGFSAQYSVDIDGEIVRFDWDLDNDGNFELIDGGIAQNVFFSEPGTYLVNVRATDNNGNTATGLGMIYLD